MDTERNPVMYACESCGFLSSDLATFVRYSPAVTEELEQLGYFFCGRDAHMGEFGKRNSRRVFPIAQAEDLENLIER